MLKTIKNIIIYVILAAVLTLVYLYFIKKSPNQEILISSVATTLPETKTNDQTSKLTKDFLSILLNVKNIKLDDSIFLSPAFSNLRDSSISLIQDQIEGRPNPFAPLGSDIVATPITPITPIILPVGSKP